MSTLWHQMLGGFLQGEVSELADEHDLGSCAERRGGSSPPFPTRVYDRPNVQVLL